jgi:multidrug efflux pump subunit AcrB
MSANTATYFMQKKVTSMLVACILLLGGIAAYFSLGQLEDPEFTIKEAMVMTAYPGANAQQVEEEVTYPLENAIQQLPYVDKISSISKPGLSQITVSMKNIYGAKELAQIWDELRRKINDQSASFSGGIKAPQVLDDFGDVYGMLLAITGDGYSMQEVADFTDYLRRELILVPGVGKISLAGVPEQYVYVDISSEKLANLGISLNRLYEILDSQTTVVSAGNVRAGRELVRISPSGAVADISDLQNILLSAAGAKQLIYLKDVAQVYKGDAQIPSQIVSYNGQQALHLGVSFAKGVNVVDVGAAVSLRINQLIPATPVGMDVHVLYNQPSEVQRSVADFIYNLIAAVVIVVLVLLVFMGLRSGFIIGLILLLTILGTFIVMSIFNIDLHRISLGALIIALGMLVDNAIVVTEGILVGLQKGQSKLKAAYDVVQQTQWPLLGATVIAITAFAPIGLSPDATGEFAGSLFWVLLISLLLSWFTAISLTPFFCDVFLPAQQAAANEPADPYKGIVFVVYRSLLDAAMHHRIVTVLCLVGLLLASVLGFGLVRQSFFPPSTTPVFLVDYWLPEGTDIHATEQEVNALENHIRADQRVSYVASSVGMGELRFMLTYAVEKRYSSYGQLMIRSDDKNNIVPLIRDIMQYSAQQSPDAVLKIKRLEIGPSSAAKIEARFTGPDPDVLRRLGNQAMALLSADAGASNIRQDWRERVKVLRPEFDEAAARRLGIGKHDLDNVLAMSFSGKAIGMFHGGTDVLPIVVRPPEDERLDVDAMQDLQIFSPVYNRYVPIEQVVSEFRLEWQDDLIVRRDRKRTLTVMADPYILGTETATAVFKRVRPAIEAIPLPAGYNLSWGGEHEASSDAQASLFGSLPIGYLVMFVITVLLFNEFKSALVIWACVPLALIGVTAGMLSTGADFGFMALLGMLSLSGMVLKNGIVLLDQINLELAAGKDAYQAVVEASISRVRPVCMAAITTILGMLPLLTDDFFASMAVVICFGLGFATLLTLLVVPVLYVMSHHIVVPTGDAHAKMLKP